jgi:adenylate cyclase
VLQGSVRKSSGRVRITGQLIDAASGAHIWADHFDAAMPDVFELQDRCAASVVNAIAPTLEEVEIQRARAKTAHLGAYDHYLRGLPDLYRWERAANEAALRSFRDAIALDPGYASPYATATLCYVQRKANNWLHDLASEAAEALRLASQAAELGKNDAECLAYSGATIAYFEHQISRGAVLIARSLALNPNFAAGWHYSGWVHIWMAQPETAIQHLQTALRLNPRDPLVFNVQSALAHACFYADRYAEGIGWANAALAERPNFANALRILAATAASAGRTQDAAAAVSQLKHALPHLRVSGLRDLLGPYDPADVARYEDALRRAGVPD